MKKYLVLLCSIVVFFFYIAVSEADLTIIPVTKFTASDLLSEVPAGWNLEKKTGKPVVRMKKEENTIYINLISHGDSSFGLRREFHVDVRKYPILCWRWKANKLPSGGDIRKSSTDDQAIQLYVAFKAARFPAITNTPVIGYVWDSEAPRGWSGRSPQTGGDKLRCIVLRNRTDQTGQWYTERRNLYKDYKRLFSDIKGGEPQGLTTGLQIHINSQRTKTPADSLIGEIYFSAEPTDIALADAASDVRPLQDAKISAVKPPAPPVISAVKKQPSGDCLDITIDFKPGSADVSGDYSEEMQSILKYMIKNPKTKITLTGHTDNTGKSQSNVELSRKRAACVRKYLVENYKIDPQRLKIKGLGGAKPVANNATEDGRNKNNRVTINECP